MPVVVVTRMAPSKPRFIPPFMMGSLRAAAQARRCPGYRAGALRVERGPVFWTLTVWQDGRHMAEYRDSGAHRALTPKMSQWGKEAAFAMWQSDSTALPSWEEAHRRLTERAKFSTLDSPTPAHTRQELPPGLRPGIVGPIPVPRARQP